MSTSAKIGGRHLEKRSVRPIIAFYYLVQHCIHRGTERRQRILPAIVLGPLYQAVCRNAVRAVILSLFCSINAADVTHEPVLKPSTDFFSPRIYSPQEAIFAPDSASRVVSAPVDGAGVKRPQ
jgi:hypothetical protein